MASKNASCLGLFGAASSQTFESALHALVAERNVEFGAHALGDGPIAHALVTEVRLVKLLLELYTTVTSDGAAVSQHRKIGRLVGPRGDAHRAYRPRSGCPSMTLRPPVTLKPSMGAMMGPDGVGDGTMGEAEPGRTYLASLDAPTPLQRDCAGCFCPV
jgi:hypothetical protein